jgi:hypothetical protein
MRGTGAIGRRLGAAALAGAMAGALALGAAGCSTTASKQSGEADRLRAEASDVVGGSTSAPKGPVDPYADPAIQAACRTEAETLKTALEAWHATSVGDPTSTPWPTGMDDLLDPDTGVLGQAPKYYRIDPGDGSQRPPIVLTEGSPCPAVG